MREMLQISQAFRQLEGEACALATVIQVEGSAYRRPGARMLITPEGQSWGMISGGCLEHDILQQARRCLQTGEPRIVRYDSTSEDDVVFGTGLGCNGIVDVFVEPVSQPFQEAFVEAVEHCHHTRQPGAIATVVEGTAAHSEDRHAFLGGEHWTARETRLLPLLRSFSLNGEGSVLLSKDVVGGDGRIFVQPLLPPVQVVIFGGWLDVLPLLRIAHNVGFQVVVVDSRQRVSSRHFFREAETVLLASPAEALSRIRIDERTVAVVMNHHFESDQEALSALTEFALPFVGMLGPKRRQQKIVDALESDDVRISDEFRRRLHGPVGLDLGASTPEEIALSIVAEILAVLNRRSAEPIRERIPPIHSPLREPAYV